MNTTPFTAARMSNPTSKPASAVRRARRVREAPSSHVFRGLRWPDIIDNIRANKCHSDADILRISVHYRFLSAFVHPLTDQHDLLYGRNHTEKRFDHYSSELILLYINFFAAYESKEPHRRCQ